MPTNHELCSVEALHEEGWQQKAFATLPLPGTKTTKAFQLEWGTGATSLSVKFQPVKYKALDV